MRADRTGNRNGPPEPTFNDLISEPTWLIGISMTVGSEIGNFAAYGDPNTPSSIVASLGCVCVACNWVLTTIWLKEPFRRRDLGGVAAVGRRAGELDGSRDGAQRAV